MVSVAAFGRNKTAFSEIKSDLEERNIVSFGSGKRVLYEVKRKSITRNVLPGVAFATAITSFLGYLGGSLGLFYDSYKENGCDFRKMFAPKIKNKNQGIKTITVDTQIGKQGMKLAQIGIISTSLSGFACGLGEGIPLMSIGEGLNAASGPIIQTPVGTGLFGIGIGTVFSSLALENTPELKLNKFKYLAASKNSEKAKLVFENIIKTSKEVAKSVFEVAQNITNPKFLKENFLRVTPKTVVFQETIDKDGKVIINRVLKHNKNYLMHSASFILGLGGLGVIIFSLSGMNKSQKNSLKVEEAGFLFDNLGMTKFGVDKFATNGRLAGSPYVVGGAVNSVSQFMGIDDKNGRAMQWLGISFVFMGFGIDRGKNLKKSLANSKYREGLTDVVREWKFDVSAIIGEDNKDELKKVLLQIKRGENVTNTKFNNFEKVFRETIGSKFQDSSIISNQLRNKLDSKITKDFEEKKIADFEETKKALKICTEKIFGSENPKVV